MTRVRRSLYRDISSEVAACCILRLSRSLPPPPSLPCRFAFRSTSEKSQRPGPPRIILSSVTSCRRYRERDSKRDGSVPRVSLSRAFVAALVVARSLTLSLSLYLSFVAPLCLLVRVDCRVSRFLSRQNARDCGNSCRRARELARRPSGNFQPGGIRNLPC